GSFHLLVSDTGPHAGPQTLAASPRPRHQRATEFRAGNCRSRLGKFRHLQGAPCQTHSKRPVRFRCIGLPESLQSRHQTNASYCRKRPPGQSCLHPCAVLGAVGKARHPRRIRSPRTAARALTARLRTPTARLPSLAPKARSLARDAWSLAVDARALVREASGLANTRLRAPGARLGAPIAQPGALRARLTSPKRRAQSPEREPKSLGVRSVLACGRGSEACAYGLEP